MGKCVEVGDVLHGYCGGWFGRDSYDCSRVEAVGPDWLVARIRDGFKDDGGVRCADGAGIRERLAEYVDPDQWHRHDPDNPCPFSDKWRSDDW